MKAQTAQVADWAGVGANKASQVAPDSSWAQVPLLPEEGKRYFQNKGVTSCTFFSGDVAAAEAQIRSKLDQTALSSNGPDAKCGTAPMEKGEVAGAVSLLLGPLNYLRGTMRALEGLCPSSVIVSELQAREYL